MCHFTSKPLESLSLFFVVTRFGPKELHGFPARMPICHHRSFGRIFAVLRPRPGISRAQSPGQGTPKGQDELHPCEEKGGPCRVSLKRMASLTWAGRHEAIHTRRGWPPPPGAGHHKLEPDTLPTSFHADFGKEFPSRILWRGPS